MEGFTLQDAIFEFAPLFGLSFSIFVLKGFRFSHSVRWVKGFWTHLIDIILSGALGAFLIVSFCILARTLHGGLDALALIALAVFLSVGGVSFVDAIVFKYFGIHIIDSNFITGDRKGDKDE